MWPRIINKPIVFLTHDYFAICNSVLVNFLPATDPHNNWSKL